MDNILLENIECLKSEYNITMLSNACALINSNLDNINWCGFYLLRDNKLVLGPFQGEIACDEIKIGKGVCGTAVLKDEVIVVPDVNKFEGHIACSSKSKSEIVIPIHYNNKVYGVLDIDSPVYDRFSDSDKKMLIGIVKKIENIISNKD